MNKNLITAIFLITASITSLSTPARACPKETSAKKTTLQAVLDKLDAKTKIVETYQALLEYKVSQPLLESQTLRKGRIYYRKSPPKSRLRINFHTLKQDDEKPQKYIEQYIFDGTWLTHIDYQVGSVKRYQQAEPNEPVDAFELIGRNFPIIGFSKIDNLKKQFEIELLDPNNNSGDFIELKLKTKPESIYKDRYTNINFFIDRKLYLPAKIVTVTSEADVYEIKLLDAKVNKPLDKKVFEFEVPAEFGEPEIFPLKKEKNQ